MKKGKRKNSKRNRERKGRGWEEGKKKRLKCQTTALIANIPDRSHHNIYASLIPVRMGKAQQENS